MKFAILHKTISESRNSKKILQKSSVNWYKTRLKMFFNSLFHHIEENIRKIS